MSAAAVASPPTFCTDEARLAQFQLCALAGAAEMLSMIQEAQSFKVTMNKDGVEARVKQVSQQGGDEKFKVAHHHQSI